MIVRMKSEASQSSTIMGRIKIPQEYAHKSWFPFADIMSIQSYTIPDGKSSGELTCI